MSTLYLVALCLPFNEKRCMFPCFEPCNKDKIFRFGNDIKKKIENNMSIFGVQNVIVGTENIFKKQLHDAICIRNSDRATFQVE